MDIIQKTYISGMLKWANDMESALHALTGEGGFYPPFSFPAVIRGYKTKPVVVPDKKDVSPELLSDIQAIIDECNAAITETFTDAPAKFSANDMPGIILSHVTAGGTPSPWTLLHSITFSGSEEIGVTSVVTQEQATVNYSPDIVCVSSMILHDNGNNTYSHFLPWSPNQFVTFSKTGDTVLSWYKVTI